MRKDLTKTVLESSFLSAEKDTETILRKLFIESRPYSDILKKLLVINTKDCLNNPTYDAFVQNINLSELFEKGYFRLAPKIELGEHEETMSYILITFDNYTPNATNPEYRDCTVTFDIICHTDCWDIGNYRIRPLKIAGYIDGILNKTKLSGIGEFQFAGCNELILDSSLSGYSLMYRAVHDVDGDDKIEPSIYTS